MFGGLAEVRRGAEVLDGRGELEHLLDALSSGNLVLGFGGGRPPSF